VGMAPDGTPCRGAAVGVCAAGVCRDMMTMEVLVTVE
jgi:hypothetical protein